MEWCVQLIHTGEDSYSFSDIPQVNQKISITECSVMLCVFVCMCMCVCMRAYVHTVRWMGCDGKQHMQNQEEEYRESKLENHRKF